MGIQVTGTVQPTIVFDQVHLVSLSITQPQQELHTSPANYHVMIVYQLFGVDGANKRYYNSELHEIEINDFLEKAMKEYAAGDPTLVTAFKAIEAAIASLIQSDRGISARVT